VGGVSGAYLAGCATSLWRTPLHGCAAGGESPRQGLLTQSLPRKETHVDYQAKCSLLLSDFKKKLNVSKDFNVNLPIRNLIKIRSEVLEL
jgi:hypothetical protein